MAQTGAGSIEFVGKVMIDASELMKVLGMSGGGKVTAGGGTPVSGGGGDEEQAKVIQKGMRKSYKDPSFMSIFRPLVALEGLKGLVANSRVTNTYLGAMGKMFSAAIDLLLLPFTPIFNLLMVAMAKLMGWLIDSGVLEWIGEGVNELIKLFGGFVNWVKLLFTDPGKAIMDAVKWLWGQIKEFFKDPLGALGNVAKVAVAGAAVTAGLAMMPVIGGPVRALLGAGASAVGGMLGFGGGRESVGKTPPVPPPSGGGGRGGGRFGPGGMGRMMGGGLLFGGGMMAGQATGSSILGMGGMGAGVGMMAGGPLGALAGAGIGAGIGLLDKKLLGGKIGGFLGMGGGGGGGGGGKAAEKIINIGTQNVSMNIKVEDPKIVKEMYSDIDEKTTQSAQT